MGQVRLTSEADEEIVRLALHIAQDNPIAAHEWIDDLRQKCELLATQPEIGQRVRTRRFGEIRRHVLSAYVIYYRPEPSGIQVLLVAHGARDQNRLL